MLLFILDDLKNKITLDNILKWKKIRLAMINNALWVFLTELYLYVLSLFSRMIHVQTSRFEKIYAFCALNQYSNRS